MNLFWTGGCSAFMLFNKSSRVETCVVCWNIRYDFDIWQRAQGTNLASKFPRYKSEHASLRHSRTNQRLQLATHRAQMSRNLHLTHPTGFVHIFKVKFKHFSSTLKGHFQNVLVRYRWGKIYIYSNIYSLFTIMYIVLSVHI